MSKLKHLLRSICDGSLPIRIYNRFLKVPYVPQTEITSAQLLAKNYPDDGWKKMTPEAQGAWCKYSPVFQGANISSIVHVGANDGGMSIALNGAFPGMQFFLIEPLPHVFQKLENNIRGLSNIRATNLAAGATEDSLEMNVDEHSMFSSLLPYDPLALKEYPQLRAREKIKVLVQPLDKIISTQNIQTVDLLIIDVQGYEDAVLAGAPNVLASCKVVICELTLQNLYQGTSTFDSVYQKLGQAGFKLKFLLSPMRGSGNYILQIDGVFIRDSIDDKSPLSQP